MSEVFSFRLDKNNPREARVLEFLNCKHGIGYSLRQIIVEAILNFEETNPNRISTPILNELHILITQLNYILERFEGQNNLLSSENQDTLS